MSAKALQDRGAGDACENTALPGTPVWFLGFVFDPHPYTSEQPPFRICMISTF